MRIVGIRRAGNGPVEVADLRSTGRGEVVVPIAGLDDFWSDARGHLARGGGDVAGIPRADVTLVPPVLPGARVFCVGLNYRRHHAEGSYSGDPIPEVPTIFARWTSSLAVGDGVVEIPDDEEGLDWEGEVMAWVGADLAVASADEAHGAVVGYSTFDDLTARGAQKRTSQWTLGKNVDGSGPLGPMVPADEVGDLRDGLRVRTRVNGATVQDASTDEMVFTVGETLAYVSRTVTVRAGDLVATGTPSGVGYARDPQWLLGDGDLVEVEVERLGTLRTTVVRRRPIHSSPRGLHD
ncbi:fumarylacetoacetate hydrolase family protein [Rhodococcoides corynebacterioides]|uniref:fumarylacetoacetate hydrolase family protein n=1 Tax=Rhodococcoides corynebacterioides TaxID=53972 RepID=UPI001C9B0F35|nr:fumarylacetoacetate hydrolase family protein [Rhodococcus corynebacterioides]MBY6351106.1 fumarylacetoacetate hydrolase family protein [Rhodococcus corynebacterioides]